MSRIVFIQPGRVTGNPAEMDPARGMTAHPALAYVAAATRKAGHDVAVVDAWTARLPLKETVQRTVAFAPDVIAFTTATPQICAAAATAKAIRRVLPKVTTVIGGAHPTALPTQTLEEFPVIDVAISGEGERSFCEWLERIDDPDSWGQVTGVTARVGDSIVSGPEYGRITDLDSLPFPAFDLFELDRPGAIYSTWKKGRSLTLTTARGCPYRCTFCQNPMGTQYRTRSIDNVMEEIEWVTRTFNARRLTLTDETFTLYRKRTVALCEALLRADMPRRLNWSCITRADAVDPELLALLRRAGCDSVFFGIETGDPETMKQIQKRLDTEQTVRAVRWAQEAGLFVHANVILGLPGDTMQSALETIRYALRVGPDACGFNILAPWPGTKIYEAAKRGEHGLRLLTTDWSQFGVIVGGSLETDTLSRRQLERLQLYGYARFFLRPSKIANLFKVGDPRDIPTVLLQFVRQQVGEYFRWNTGSGSSPELAVD